MAKVAIGDSLTFLRSNSAQRAYNLSDSERGVTLMEVLVTMALLAIFTGTAVANIDVLDRPLDSATNELSAYLKLVRARSVSTTQAHFISPISATRVGVATGINCGVTTPTTLPDTFLDLPRGITLPDTSWSLCFNSRGVADVNLVLNLEDKEGQSDSIEVFLGGAIRRTP